MLCQLVASVEILLFIVISIQCRLLTVVITRIELPVLIAPPTTHRDDFIEGAIIII